MRFPALRDALPHLRLGVTPTPVRRLEALERLADARTAGDEIWLKDDGVFGGAWGGNKARKLEWILPDVRRRGRRTIFTVGALGTNHGLATAQLARIERSGARVYRTRGIVRTVASLPLIYASHTDWRRLRPPYFLTVGGSSALGAVGYVEAALELADQVERGEVPQPAQIVVALGSGGTAAGLVLGLALAGLPARLVAIQVNDRAPLTPRRIARLAERARRLLERRGARLRPVRISPADVRVETRWLGGGYGHHTAEADQALETARAEGLKLEPVYTGKAMAAMLALRAGGELGGGPALYWHTYNALEV